MSFDVTDRATGDGWDGILAEGETITWQGRPDAAVEFGFAQSFGMLFGVAFAGFAAVWMALASSAGGYFWTFGLIHFSVGIALAVGSVFWPPWVRRHTWYTLTDRRAFIATDLPFRGRKLIAYEVGPDTPLSLEEDGDLETVNFAHRWVQTKKGSRREDVGFERIPDGRVVLELMRRMQGEER